MTFLSFPFEGPASAQHTTVSDSHTRSSIHQDMRDSNPPVQPDIITYSTLVKVHCRFGVCAPA